MAHRLSTGTRIALCGALAIAAAGVAKPALAYDDGYQNVFSSVLTAVGVLPPDKTPDIDYRERPPLVLPPKTTLVKPEEQGAKRTAAWPTDPDVVRRRKEADEMRSPIALFEKNDRRIPKEEMLKYRAAQPEQDIAPSGCSAFEHSMVKCRPNPDEMRAQEQRFKDANPEKTDLATAGVEPERSYLTQPPKGYLKPTKTIAATREAPEKKHDTSNPLSSFRPTDAKNIDPLNN